MTRYHTGDGVTTERAYDPLTGRLSGIVSWKGNDTIQYLTYVFDKNANLASRKDSIRNMEERFIYDRLDRLTGIIEGNDTTGVFVYDDYGRMTMKRIHGAMVFDNTTYGADGRPHALEQASLYTERPEQRIKYTSFDKLRNIQQNGTLHYDEAWLRYDYGYEHQRLRMTEAILLDTVVKEYVGNCEFVKTNGVTTSELTFLSGPLGVFAVYDGHVQPAGKGMYYVHPDHLGSWTTVTNRNGVVVQDVRFDPWGTPYYSDSTHLVEATSLLFDRGFTGHEHLLGFRLINMNGRMYDPVTSTFLSVDNFVQDPSSTQSFNRYAYCMNNPLKYTDPDGEFPWVSMLIGAGISVVTNGIDNILKDKPFFDGAGKAALYGGLQGLASFGIGQLASGISSVGSRVAFQTLAHGSLGGVSSTLNGGNFTQGFVSGAVGSLVATGMGGLTQDWGKWGRGIGVIGGGALAGGVSSSISGGRFWDGFRNGAISAGLNHAVHTGVFGRGVMMASITGRTRHLFGPDAIARAVTMDASAGVALSAEAGGISVLVGKERGFYAYEDLGIGAGGLTASLGVEVVDMYSSSSLSEVGIQDFSGSRWEINGSLAAYGFSVGVTGTWSRHNNDGFTIGIGRSIGVDAMPFNANLNFNYGGSNVGNLNDWVNQLHDAFTIKKL